jgi:hypothetical protein
MRAGLWKQYTLKHSSKIIKHFLHIAGDKVLDGIFILFERFTDKLIIKTFYRARAAFNWA